MKAQSKSAGSGTRPAAQARWSAVLADDQEIFREGLKLLLESRGRISVVAQAASGFEAVEAVERLGPDLLIVEWSLPGLSGLEVLRRAAKAKWAARVIILSAQASERHVLEALKAGACGYVLKQSSAADLLQAVGEVTSGRRYLSPAVCELAVEACAARAAGVRRDAGAGRVPVSLREGEVMKLITDGKTSAEIGRLLGISARTVEHHRASLMRKLACRNTAELIRHALDPARFGR